MKKNTSAKKENATGKNTVITLEMSPEDAKRLQRAFEDGRLKELFGVVEINVLPLEDMDLSEKKWSQKVRRKRNKPKDDEAPPLP